MTVELLTTSTTQVAWWIGSPNAADVTATVRSLRDKRAKDGRRPFYVCVVAPASRPPDDGGRKAFLDMASAVMDDCEQFHLVLACNPFVKAIARGLVATSNLQGRYPDRVFVHDSLDQALMRIYGQVHDPGLLKVEMPASAMDGAGVGA